MAIPTRQQSFELLWHHNVPDNVIRHSIVVSRVAARICGALQKEGVKVDSVLVDRACILHDIAKISAKQKGVGHEQLGHEILKKHGYDEVARIVLKHALHYILDKKNAPKTIEEKIVYYADKRVMHHKIVELKVRIDDLKLRYPQYKDEIKKS